jgi:3-dehydroquinate synthase
MLYFNVVTVEIGSVNATYEAVIGSSLIGDLGGMLSNKIGARPCAIIADTNTGPLYGAVIEQSLTTSGIQPIRITVPGGEQSKTLDQVGSICDQMLAAGLDRHSFVVGVGGGVIGDLSGFVAAIFQRGVPHVQVPTTLLAMVDSSIGGKTGVNRAAGKNLIGAVHHPLLVVDDVELLRSLPEREFRQGFTEIIKHGILNDTEMFEELKAGKICGWRPQNFTADELVPLIRRNIEVKSRIVSKDELDRNGDRALLNFGHTVGHGIERAGGYERFLHGEAISLGMVAASHISVKRAGLPAEQHDAIVDVLARFDLPTRLSPDVSRAQIMDALKFDKKFQQGQIRFVVTPRIGNAYLSSEVTLQDIQDALTAL